MVRVGRASAWRSLPLLLLLSTLSAGAPGNCPLPHFLCPDKVSCVEEGRVCDGVEDCPLTETSSGGEDEENCSSGDGPLPSRFLDKNMCGIPDIHQRTPHENPEMTCPWDTEQDSGTRALFQCSDGKKLEPGQRCNGVDDCVGAEDEVNCQEYLPWLGQMRNTENGHAYLGVVIASDTITSDESFLSHPVPENKLEFVLTQSGNTIHRSGVKGISTNMDGLKMFNLLDPIPEALFRPVCLPPPGYISRMVKPSSCQQGGGKLIKVTLNPNGRMRMSSLKMVDGAKCSSNLLEATSCTGHLKNKYISSTTSPLRPDVSFIDSTVGREYVRRRKFTTISSDYYKCHLGAVKAAEDCNLDEIEQETVCHYAKKDQCLGLAYSSGANVTKQEVEEQNEKCHAKINGVKTKPGDYGECVVNSFKDIRKGSEAHWAKYPTDYWSAFPYQGINCLHEYIDMPPCAKHPTTAGLKPLGDQWGSNPCSKRRDGRFGPRRFISQAKCYADPANRYYLKSIPYQSHFSLTMYNRLADFAASIENDLGCGVCTDGNLCVMDDAEEAGQSFLFWFDICRQKHFFLGPQQSRKMSQSFPNSCNQPRVYQNMEEIATRIQETVGTKADLVDLYPKPVIVVLGATGVGKSTTANSLISGNGNRANCFSTGGGTSSKTKVTKWMVGRWQGVGQCVTVVDTPGTDDTGGKRQDYNNIKKLTTFLKEDLKQIDIFLVMFKEDNVRFVSSMQKALNIFTSIFGDTFWRNMATEFTYWSYGQDKMKSRYNKRCTENFELKPGAKDQCLGTTPTSPFESTVIAEPPFGGIDPFGGNPFGDTFGIDPGEIDYSTDPAVSSDLDPTPTEDFAANLFSSDDMACKLIAADEKGFNAAIFKDQDILNPHNWKNLEQKTPYEPCSTTATSMTAEQYEKADYVTRLMKHIEWGRNYGQDITTVPSLFIHPVWDESSRIECQRFKRETSNLMKIAEKMDPFLCSDKCSMPEEFFQGTPMLLDYVDTNVADVNYDSEQFSLTCTMWHGPDAVHFSGADVSWLVGWQPFVQFSQQDVVVNDVKDDKEVSFVELTLRGVDESANGIYQCSLNDSPLQFSSDVVTVDSGTRQDVTLSCRLDMPKEEVARQKAAIRWFKADVITDKLTSPKFSTSFQSPAKAQFSLSILTMNFDVGFPEDFAKTYACRFGIKGISNNMTAVVSKDAEWQSWQRWSTCSKTCQEAIGLEGTRTRTRGCTEELNNGKTCAELATTSDATEIEACNKVCCPKHGEYKAWNRWETCMSKTNPRVEHKCSPRGGEPGEQRRTRGCTPHSCGGRPCAAANLVEKRPCNGFDTAPCPIDGGWGRWGAVSECIVQRGTCHGTKRRERKCDSPKPEHGGKNCEGGGSVEEEGCTEAAKCPVPCQCREWGSWGSCSITCANCGAATCINRGEQTRRRFCSEPKNGGESCEVLYGDVGDQYRPCPDVKACPIHCSWTRYTDWGTCDLSTGIRKQTRKVRQEAKFGGDQCIGEESIEESCPVDCQCAGSAWGSWSACSGTCGAGTKERRRNCLAAKNNGAACHSDPLRADKFAERQQGKCTHDQRCPRSLVGEWTGFGSLSECSVQCGGGTQRKTRQCVFPNFPDFTPGFDHEVQCPGSSVQVISNPPCKSQSCAISTLFFLMDTTGSFSGVDQNTALTLGSEIIEELDKQGVEVPRFQITTVDDPCEPEIGSPVTDSKTFREELFALYKRGSQCSGNRDWPERSTKGLLQTCKTANADAVLCLFTDAATKEHDLEQKIQKIVTNKDISIYIFLTPDYPITPGVHETHYANPIEGIPSFKLYQRLSKRHTYIMSKTEPSSASLIIEKALKRSNEDTCYTYAGPEQWENMPNECYFPFHHNGKTYTTCTSDGKTQPWCATVVKRDPQHPFPVISNKGGAGWEGWGYCGNCRKEGRSPQCERGAHTVLNQAWRAVKDVSVASHNSDTNLPSGSEWFKFDVPGTSNKIPHFKRGVEQEHHCGGRKYARIEMPPNGKLADHKEYAGRDFAFCFDAQCTPRASKVIKMQWCQPYEPNGQPFYIYKLKPLSSGEAYCVE